MGKSKGSSQDSQQESRRVKSHSSSYPQLSATTGAGNSVGEHQCNDSTATNSSEELSAGSIRNAIFAKDTSSVTLHSSVSNYEVGIFVAQHIILSLCFATIC